MPRNKYWLENYFYSDSFFVLLRNVDNGDLLEEDILYPTNTEYKVLKDSVE